MIRFFLLLATVVGFVSGFQSMSHHSGVFALPTRNSNNKVTTNTQRRALLQAVDQFFVSSPYTTAALVCGFKASAADAVAQFQEWKTSTVKKKTGDDNVDIALEADWKRNIAFVAYGSLYQGLTQEFIYNHLYPVWFGTGSAWTVVLSKVVFSLLVQTTLLTLPSLYLIKGIIERTNLKEALGKYVDDVKTQQLLQKFYYLWGPVLTMTFSVVPQQWRVTFIAVVSFFWLIILSKISNNMSDADKDRYCAIGGDFCEFDFEREKCA